MAEYITKEQVIEWFRPYGHTDEGIPYYGLVTDIRGMKAADVAPVVHCGGERRTSMRLIDADEIKKRMCFKCNYEYSYEPCEPSDCVFCNAINDASTLDAVPVVRCRECIQGEEDDPDFPDQYYCHAGCGWNKGDFYCAYGERKECADNG